MITKAFKLIQESTKHTLCKQFSLRIERNVLIITHVKHIKILKMCEKTPQIISKL